MATSVTVQVSISPCCDRLKFLSDALTQCKNLALRDDYCIAIENLILDLVPFLKNSQFDQIVTTYDNAIDNILTLRDEAFLDWSDSVKNTIIPVQKTPPPPE